MHGGWIVGPGEPAHPSPGDYMFLGTAGSGTWHARHSSWPW